MLNKEKILKKLEEERQFAIKINEPAMALGIAQAIQVVRSMDEERNTDWQPFHQGS